MAHQQQPGDEPGAADPLELEHMIGFAASHDNAVQFHPKLPDTFVCYTGCLILIGCTTDPHQQEFLRGHDEEITCLAISPSGNLVASGQASKTRSPSSEAYVIVWDFGTRQLRGCTQHGCHWMSLLGCRRRDQPATGLGAPRLRAPIGSP
jgi:WD40 repeat protein